MRRLHDFIVVNVVGATLLVFSLVYIGTSVAYSRALTRQAKQATLEVAAGASVGLYQLMKTGAVLPQFVQEFEKGYEDVLTENGYEVRFRRMADAVTRFDGAGVQPEPEPEILEVAKGGRVTLAQAGQVTRVLVPLQAEAQCLTCHSRLKVGQGVGVVEVRHDLTPHVRAARGTVGWLLLALVPIPLIAATIGTRVLNNRIRRSMALVDQSFLKTDADGAAPLQSLGFVEFTMLFASLTAKLQQAMTEQQNLQNQLRQAQKMEALGTLAGGIAHDFNNLLTPILGYTQLAMSGLREKSPLRADLAEVYRAGERASALTQRLLAFGRKQSLQLVPVDLNKVVAGMEGLLRPLMGEAVSLVFRLAPEVEPVKVDVGQIEQVVMNLVINSRDAMPNGGTVTIKTTSEHLREGIMHEHPEIRQGDYVRLSITDTGRGMDVETLGHLFEPFFTTKKPGEGTGLGLATVYGIIKQSGGYVFAESRLGHGSTFTVWLPATREEIKEARPSDQPEPLPSGTKTILIVEDEPGVRRLAHQVLLRCGYSVLEAVDGNDAISVSDRYVGTIDLILTDIVVPGLSGPIAAERVRARRPGIKVLYMSGYAPSQIVLDAGTPLLAKPFTPSALARAVRTILD